MKLIIDIPYEAYYTFKCDLGKGNLNALAEIVANGIPLPKGHGDLIDRDKLAPKIHGVKSIDAVLDAPTIVEADKESEADND